MLMESRQIILKVTPKGVFLNLWANRLMNRARFDQRFVPGL